MTVFPIIFLTSYIYINKKEVFWSVHTTSKSRKSMFSTLCKNKAVTYRIACVVMIFKFTKMILQLYKQPKGVKSCFYTDLRHISDTTTTSLLLHHQDRFATETAFFELWLSVKVIIINLKTT